MENITKSIDPYCNMGKIAEQDEVIDPYAVINSLLGDDDSGLSDVWRINTSSIEAAELANALRALRKVAGYIGQNTGRIEWAGMSDGGQGAIVLDPDMVVGKYPIPSKKFDYLIGIVIHEAFHRVEWTDFVWKNIEPFFNEMKVLHMIMIHKIIYFGEDIYVDMISNKSVLGNYTKTVRDIELKRYFFSLKPEETSIDELIYLWWLDSFSDKKIAVPDVYKEPLAVLRDLANNLKDVGNLKKGVTERCRKRSDLYLDAWGKLEGMIGRWKIIDKGLLWYPINEDEAALAKKKKVSGKQDNCIDDILHEIETRLAFDSKDITPIIRSVVGDDEKIVPTSKWNFNIPAHPVVDSRLVARLRAIFQNYADRRVMLSRGLINGRIDKRRLYRASINARCFQEKQNIPHMDWNICILVDASGSMRGSKWRMVENTIGTIHKSFIGFQNRLQAYAYFEVDKICMISGLIKKKRLLSIPPSGRTASGQAIIAAAYFMPHDGRRSFLIHITDGESNFGCDVSHGIEYCREKHVHLVTLGCGYKDREEMAKQYGNTIQFLDHFGQLPNVLEKLLKWTLIYGGRQNSKMVC